MKSDAAGSKKALAMMLSNTPTPEQVAHIKKILRKNIANALPPPQPAQSNENDIPHKQHKSLDVLLLTHELSLTGAPRAVYYAALAVKAQGGFPVILSPLDGPMRKEFEKSGIAVCIDPKMHATGLSENRLNFIQSFDIAICSTIVTWNYVWQLAKSTTIPILFWVHETYLCARYVENNPQIKDLAAMPNVHTITCSRHAQQYIKKVIIKEPEVIYHGFDLPIISPSPEHKYEQELRTAIVGTIDKNKGQDCFVDAVKSLSSDIREKSQYILLGGLLQDELTEQSALWTSEKDIHITGHLPHEDAIQYMMSCDIIVCASREESFSLSILEAMALGKAVIVPDHIGIAEILENDISCLKFASADIVSLSAAMSRLIENRVLREYLGKNAKSIYEKNFTGRVFQGRFMALLERIAATRKVEGHA